MLPTALPFERGVREAVVLCLPCGTSLSRTWDDPYACVATLYGNTPYNVNGFWCNHWSVPILSGINLDRPRRLSDNRKTDPTLTPFDRDA